MLVQQRANQRTPTLRSVDMFEVHIKPEPYTAVNLCNLDNLKSQQLTWSPNSPVDTLEGGEFNLTNLIPHFCCTCGEHFPSQFALDLHIAGGGGAGVHGLLADSRPRLGGAFLVFDDTAPNPYRALIAAASFRFRSRGLQVEQSNYAEEQIMAIALQQVEALLGQSNEACEILIVSDSQVTLTGLRNVAFLRQQTTRQFVRQPEATVLCV